MLYTGTFSKVLFPGLRLADLVVADEQNDAFARQAGRLPNYCPQLLQATVTAFLYEGHFARHLKKCETSTRAAVSGWLMRCTNNSAYVY